MTHLDWHMFGLGVVAFVAYGIRLLALIRKTKLDHAPLIAVIREPHKSMRRRIAEQLRKPKK